MQSRNKTIEEIEHEISKIKEEAQRFEENMQNQIDSYVKSKIILFKDIDEIKARI
jgi:hypothetical protein